MKRLVTTMMLLLIAAGGCGDNKDPPAASNAGTSTAPSAAGEKTAASNDDKEKPPVDKGKDGKENVELAEAYAKEVCECKNAQCINKAGEKYHEATNKLYEDRQVRTPTPEQKAKMDEASARVSECTNKLLKGK